MKQKILITFSVILLAGFIFIYKLVWGKPFSFNHAVERITMVNLLNDPETLTFLGMMDNTILDFHSDELTDASPAYEKSLIDRAREGIALLKSYDPSGLDEQEKLTLQIMEWYCRDSLIAEKFPWHNNNIKCIGPYPVNQLFGVQGELPDFMSSTHRIIDEKSARNYVARLNGFDEKFGQVIAALKMREKLGVIPPRFVINRVLVQMKNFITPAPSKNVLYNSFHERIDPLDKINASTKAEIGEQVETAIRDAVYPGYRQLISYMTGLRKKATNNDGLWKLPRGDEYYQELLRYHTTTSMKPEEIHRLGLQEVKGIETEIRAQLKKIGMGGLNAGAAFKRLSAQKRFHFPDTPEGKKQVLAKFTAIVNDMDSHLKEFFGILPKQKVVVKRIPAFKERGAPAAYYNPPAMDGSRPGIFFANLRKASEIDTFGMRTLAYHEAIPGHHLQLAIAQELKGVPTFRRVYPFTAYAEGWALYAERLAWEQGFHKNPYDNLGRLQAELFRAVRLVVDTGIHHKKWTRQRAISYMHRVTGMPIGDVTAEIERYIVMPAQACAYKVGMIKILELRKRAKKALGKKYSLKVFHDLVLKNGSMPLDILEKVVNTYINKRRHNAR